MGELMGRLGQQVGGHSYKGCRESSSGIGEFLDSRGNNGGGSECKS
jgi:hypothetical protein